MSDPDLCAARRELECKAVDLVAEAGRHGALGGSAGVDGQLVRSRLESEARAAVSSAFAEVHVEHCLSVARRDEARRRRDACDISPPGRGWFAWLRRFARWRMRRRIDAQIDRESMRAAEMAALLSLEAPWSDQIVSRVGAALQEATARGRAAAAVLGASRDPHAAGGIEDALERALSRQRTRADGGAS
jgi:hypothetical protein